MKIESDGDPIEDIISRKLKLLTNFYIDYVNAPLLDGINC
jgi:hypothetical protein